MILVDNTDYLLIVIKNESDFSELVHYLNEKKSSGNNLIINLLDCTLSHDLVIKNLLPFHFNWQKTNNSFILVSNISKKITKEIVSIQTLEEALDYFHMEQLTKNI